MIKEIAISRKGSMSILDVLPLLILFYPYNFLFFIIHSYLTLFLPFSFVCKAAARRYLGKFMIIVFSPSVPRT